MCVGSFGRDIAADSHGDIVVICDGRAPGGTNIRLYSADGALKWSKDIDGGFGDDRGDAIAVDPADRVVADGRMRIAQDDGDGWLAVFSP